jgi:hypothetical protein
MINEKNIGLKIIGEKRRISKQPYSSRKGQRQDVYPDMKMRIMELVMSTKEVVSTVARNKMIQ